MSTETDTKTVIQEVRQSLADLATKHGKTDNDFKAFETRLKAVETENTELRTQVKEARRAALAGSDQADKEGANLYGVSVGCAKYLAAQMIICGHARGNEFKEDKLIGWAKKELTRQAPRFAEDPGGDRITQWTKSAFGGDGGTLVRAPFVYGDVVVPIQYAQEIIKLVLQYGSFRKYARVLTMGARTLRLPKLGSDPAFGFIDVSASVPERNPNLTSVDLTPEKAGGILRIPTEIEEDSLVALGAFIADYIARQKAAWEDVVGWNADGTATYKSMIGVRKAVDNAGKTTSPAAGAGNTTADKVTLVNLRTVRGIPSAAVYNEGGAYYMHPTMEAALAALNNGTNLTIWDPARQLLDGYPVRWVQQLPAFGQAAASQVAVLYGSMNFFALGDRSSLRMDYSSDAYFTTDEIGIRPLWRFTVKELDNTAMAGIKLPAT